MTSDVTGSTSAVRRRVAGVAVAALICVVLLVRPVARAVGQWLVVEDVPQPAGAIVVLGGHLPFRAMEAAKTFREGWAPEVWLTRGRIRAEDVALERLQVNQVEEFEYSRQVLENEGVPASAIRVLPERNRNTAEEIATIARHAGESGDRLILVTSKFHTRRVKVLWRLLAPEQSEPIVLYTPDDLFDPTNWWHTTGDGMALAREYFGMLNAWAGFPVSSER